ncbi:hypothetical protein GCM10010402_37820 [Actinomadura luteofluorescens]
MSALVGLGGSRGTRTHNLRIESETVSQHTIAGRLGVDLLFGSPTAARGGIVGGWRRKNEV